jgi:hypothetical protein
MITKDAEDLFEYLAKYVTYDGLIKTSEEHFAKVLREGFEAYESVNELDVEVIAERN